MSFARAAGLVLVLCLGAGSALAQSNDRPADGVAVIRAAPWSPGDTVREGAGEFEVFVRVASLQQAHRSAGLIVVGGRNGLCSTGTEHALRYVSLKGVPVARLASQEDPAPDPEGVYLDAGHLTEAQASAVLSHCLVRYGPSPSALDADAPTPAELSAIRSFLAPFRRALILANAQRVAER